MSTRLNNLAITTTGDAMVSTMGILFNTLQCKLANGGSDNILLNGYCRFKHSDTNFMHASTSRISHTSTGVCM